LAGQPFKFVGQFGVMTEPSGFYYMRARYYDPQVGRFISEDPAGFGGGDTNLSIYAGDNPVNGIDPEGKDGFSIGLEGAGALFGFGGTGGIYANFSHNSSKPWYAGWSSSVTVVAGGGAAASVYGLTGGVYVGVNNTDNVSQLNGTFVNGGRLGEVVPGIRTAI
ncbi:MAG: RHS repeat-associated core domain-containing protein, partial [Nitrospiraceae bacterium]|nr:RHS repeat-associated core domain-containing protein [Nitrospiraceae bacterium]